MKNGFDRFEFYLKKFETLLAAAANEKDPGFYLYSNDARTPVFMLEGLAKLYAGIYKKNRLKKIKAHFKLLEDALGAIDYYDAFAKEFKLNNSTPITVTAYLQTQTVEKATAFNALLQKENWLSPKRNRLQKIRKQLKRINWKSEKYDVNGIAAFYAESIEDIKVLALESEKGFTELEEEVHELRRKLRWLSIYPRALQGVIQLIDSAKSTTQLERYFTPEIVNSPFNQMPEKGDNERFLLLDKNHFLALSWMISALGKLKDSGLRIVVLAEALEQTEHMDKETANRIGSELLQQSEHETDNILAKASEIAQTYFEAKLLDALVIKPSKKS